MVDAPPNGGFYSLLYRASTGPNRFLVFISLVLGASAALYWGYTFLLVGGPGFPLDDSWIHQVLARNLARYGALFFNPSEPAAATTSPLWTTLLAFGYKLGVNPYLWASLLGALFLGLTGWTLRRLSLLLFPQEPGLGTAAVFLTLIEWHLVWGAFSGMETLLFTFLTLLLMVLMLKEGSFVLKGLVGGLTTLARPEGAVLFLGTLAWRAARELRWGRIEEDKEVQGSQATSCLGKRAVLYLGSLALWGVLVAPYLAYNYLIIGRPMPSTFYAKNAFYSLGVDPLVALAYLLGVLKVLASGPFLLLLPGFVYSIFALRKWEGPWALPLAWAGGLVLLYLIWLPALYHHGRYLFPLLPIFILYGVVGTAHLLRRLPFIRLAKVAPILVALLTLVLWGNGAVVFAWDVKFIRDQEVAVALWLRDNTPPGALVATHDVGALGYFAERPILDMAGLITPQLMASPGDFQKVMGIMREQKVDYIAVFPRWYPWIGSEQRFQEVYRIREDYAIPLGGDNMVVYRAQW